MSKQRKHNCNKLIVLFFILFCYNTYPDVVHASQKELEDTVKINAFTKKAYTSARKNPEQSVSDARLALVASKKANYQKGIADANLALGAAYMAKHNPNDSATYYYHRALTIYKQTGDFTGLGRVCYGLTYLYNFQNSTEKAKEYGNLSVEYFEKAGNLKEVVSAIAAVVYLEKQAGNFKKAVEWSDKAIEMAYSIKDTAQWANALNNKGNVLKEMFLLNPAIDAYFEAFKLWELVNDTSGLAIAYGSIANAYFFEGDFKKSLDYNFKKLPITENRNNLWETNKTLNNISLAYSNLSQHDSALYYMQKSLAIAIKLNQSEEIGNCYNHMAFTFLNMGAIDSSLLYSSKALGIAEKTNSPKLASYLISNAEALNQQKKYNEALAIAKKAYQLAKQKNDRHTLKDAAFALNTIYFRLNKRDFAYPFLTEYLQLNDSLKNLEFMRKVTRLDIQHEFDKKQKAAEFEIEKSRQQIEILNKNSQIKSQRIKIFWILIVTIILLSLAGALISLLVIRNQHHRIEQMSLELQNFLLHKNEIRQSQNGNKKQKPFQNFTENFGLTNREAEILEQISAGLKNNEIAEKLFVSENTVKFHIKNIYIKLDVKNRIQALQKATT